MREEMGRVVKKHPNTQRSLSPSTYTEVPQTLLGRRMTWACGRECEPAEPSTSRGPAEGEMVEEEMR